MLKELKYLFSPYFNTVKVDFKPLEYIEVETGKPLLIKLNDKYIFKTNLQKAMNLIKFNTSKNIILSTITLLNDSDDFKAEMGQLQMNNYQLLIRLLFEISKENHKGYFAKKKYYKFLNKFLLDDIELLLNIFKKVLIYNSDLKKKALKVQNMDIFKGTVLDTTTGGQSLSALIKTDQKTGEKSFIH